MSTENFHNSAENNEQKSFEERFEAFKKMFTIKKLEDLGISVVEIKKIDATAQESAEKNKLKQTIESNANTNYALGKLSEETNEVKQRVTNSKDLEAFRIPANRNPLIHAEKILSENKLDEVLNKLQSDVEWRFGKRCTYCSPELNEV